MRSSSLLRQAPGLKIRGLFHAPMAKNRYYKLKFGRECPSGDPDLLFDEVNETEAYVLRSIEQTGYVDSIGWMEPYEPHPPKKKKKT